MKIPVVLLAFAIASAHADVRLPAIFSDHAVLQKSAKTAVWGWAEPGEKVDVVVGVVSGSAEADAKGKWRANLDLSEAGAGPFDLEVKGKNTLKVTDVLVGQVWVCGGQSNMELRLSTTKAEAAIAAAHNPQLRHFKVERNAGSLPAEDVKGAWVLTEPTTVGEFTAVAYYFGEMLQRELKVPVGLLNITWGGSLAEAWISPEALEKTEETKTRVKELLSIPPAPGKPAVPNKTPSALYHGMLAPVLPYTIAGVIWYQGESNTGSGLAPLYRNLLGILVRDWRARWESGEFPFYLCQLANYQAKRNAPNLASTWAELREVQTQFPATTPKTGTAILIDVGEAGTIHPANKKDPGERLARMALAQTYSRGDMVYSGPELKSVATEGDKMRLTFAHANGGLVAKPLAATYPLKSLEPEKTLLLERYSPNSELQGFLICGDDKKWVWADAKIEGDAVVVSSPSVPHAVAVRYAWDNNPTCNLANGAGLPAGPFRTDNFPLTVKPDKSVPVPDAQ